MTEQFELARCPIFDAMTPEECEEVLQLMDRCEFPEGETILKEGKTTAMLWVLAHGRCEVVKQMQDGQEQQLAVLEPGALFGEVSFFEYAPHSASVRALSPVHVLQLPAAKYAQLERTGSRAAHKIAAGTARILAQRLRRMNEWLNEFVLRQEVSNPAHHREELKEFRAKLYDEWAF